LIGLVWAQRNGKPDRAAQLPPELCLVCPFDLGRPSGTPIRARATLEALEGHADPYVLATSDAAGAEALAGIWKRGRESLSIPRWTAVTFRRLISLRPEVAHCFTPLAALPAVLARSFVPGMRVVVEVHGAARHQYASRRWRVRKFFTGLDRHIIRRADAVIAMSSAHARYLRDECGVRGPIEVSWGPVEPERLAATPPRADSPRRFGYFGNAIPWQGLDVLLSAARLVEDEEEIELVIGGLDRSQLPLAPGDNVRVRGSMAREAMLSAMAECDVLVSPRRGGPTSDTQYPFKLSAYLAAGRPVIGTDVSDQGSIIRSADCGVAVAPDSPEALAEAMVGLASAPAPELRRQGENGRRFAEERLGYASLRRHLEIAYGRGLDGDGGSAATSG
jgi:glycosyltransferase involved in cell wall biosynthesis